MTLPKLSGTMKTVIGLAALGVVVVGLIIWYRSRASAAVGALVASPGGAAATLGGAMSGSGVAKSGGAGPGSGTREYAEAHFGGGAEDALPKS